MSRRAVAALLLLAAVLVDRRFDPASGRPRIGEPVPGASSDAARPGQVAFLRAGRIWVFDLGTRRARELVRDAKPIDSFGFAPGLAHIAYTRVVGDRGEEAPDANVCEVVVYDLTHRRALAVARPDTATGDSPRIAGWIGPAELVLERVSGFDVAGMERWNPGTGARRPWLAGEGENASDWAVDAGTLYYTSDHGVGASFRTTLHARDLASGATRALTARRSIVAPTPSRGGGRVAFAVVDFAHGRDSLWVHERERGTERCLYTGPVGGKAAGFLQWSPDARWLAVCYSDRPSFVLAAARGRVRRVELPLRFVAWTATGEALVSRRGGLVLLHLDSMREEPLLRDCSDAVVLAD